MVFPLPYSGRLECTLVCFFSVLIWRMLSINGMKINIWLLKFLLLTILYYKLKWADCCDGSDEYDGEVKCPNACWEAGKVTRDKLKKKIDIYKEGVTIRKREVERAKQVIVKDKEELLKLKNNEKSLKGLVKKLKGKSLTSHFLVRLISLQFQPFV